MDGRQVEEALAHVHQALSGAYQEQQRRLLVVVAAQGAQHPRQPRVVRARANDTCACSQTSFPMSEQSTLSYRKILKSSLGRLGETLVRRPPPDELRTHTQGKHFEREDLPRDTTAFCATSTSVSCDSLDSASMAPSVGLLTFNSAIASGTARLQSAIEPHYLHQTTFLQCSDCPLKHPLIAYNLQEEEMRIQVKSQIKKVNKHKVGFCT